MTSRHPDFQVLCGNGFIKIIMDMKQKSFTTSSDGFTLIELVAVIVVISILSIYALPKVASNATLVNFEAIRVLNDIRYTQLLSMLSGQRYRWVKTSSTSYQILNFAGSAVMLPNGSTTYTLASGVSFGSLTNLPSSLIAFDTTGTPYTTSSSPGTLLSSTAMIPVTGTVTRNVEISPTTGYGVIV